MLNVAYASLTEAQEMHYYEIASCKAQNGHSRTEAKCLRCPSHDRKSLFLEKGEAQGFGSLSPIKISSPAL